MLPKTRPALAVAVIAFAFGAMLPLFAATAADSQRNAMASPAPQSTPMPPTDEAAAQQAPPTGGAPEAVAPPPTATSPAAADTNHFEDSVVALVNDRPISQYDLNQRMALVMSTSNIPPTPEMRKKIRDQVLEQLETELIQRQEALKNDVTVSSVEVDKQIQAILTDNRLTLDQLKAVLARGRVELSTLRGQIAAQILWQKTVEQQYASRVNVSAEQVDAEMARIAEGQNKVHYVVSEIFLAVDNPDEDEKVLKNAQSLLTQIQGGAPFPAIARQFSQSPSGAEGGDIGLIYDGQLAPELSAALAKMKTGELSPPVRSTGGYYILALRQRLEPVGTKIEDTSGQPKILPSTLPLARLLLPLGPKPAKTMIENALKYAASISSQVTSCEMLSKVATKVPGSVYMNFGMARLADLSPQVRNALAKTEPGGAAEPFMSDAGVELFVRCDKALVKQQVYVLPKREDVERQLFSEQISAMARRYSRDLKRNADIEVR
jgi:peptidyl-prolyl cis-trans isomerase SurA